MKVLGHSDRDYATIGEVVEELRGEFPGISISKVRYLEEEGLISPERTDGGYRKFKEKDYNQLKGILKLQRDKYLPLSVIKTKIKSRFFEEELKLTEEESLAQPLDDFQKVKIDDVPQITSVSIEEIEKLENYNIIQHEESEKGKVYASIDLKIMKLVKKLESYGIEPRHLRFYENFAEREASFFQQILLSSFMQKSDEGKKKALEELTGLTKITQELKSLLLQKSIRNYFHISQ